MKTIKVLLGCVIALLVVGIYILLDTRKTDNNSRQNIKMSSKNPTGKEYYKDYTERGTYKDNVDRKYSNESHYIDEDELEIALPVCEESNVENERMVMCKVCLGLGYDPLIRTQRCSACNGNKQLPESEVETAYERWGQVEIGCPMCDSTGLSYERRITPPDQVIMNVPRGYYDCKVCNGKKRGTRVELLNNFNIAQQIYGTIVK